MSLTFKFSSWKTPTEKHVKVLDLAKKYHRKELDRKSLFFYGPTGTGKTSLALTMMEAAKAEDRRVIYRTIPEIIATCRLKMNPANIGTPDEYIFDLCQFNGLLIIDEIGRSKGDNWDKNEVLFPLFDNRMEKHNLWISNYNLNQLSEHYDPAIASRMQTAYMIGFDGIEDFRGQ